MFLDWLFPKFCAGCSRPGSYLCAGCQQQITQKPLICPTCFRPAITGATHPICTRTYGLDGLWTLASYQPPIRPLIQKFKYRLVRQSGEDLVNLLIEYWVKYPTFLLEQLQKTHAKNWQLVPIPLHRRRYNWRGFNQSILLCRILASKLNLPVNDCLLRIINTSPQYRLNRIDRNRNIRQAFAMSPKHEPITDNVILFDDVWTTGVTLKTCARILKRSGVKKVWAVTIAR